MSINTLQAVGANRLSAEDATLYNKILLSRTKPKMHYMQGGTKVPLPKNSGLTVDKRRIERPTVSQTPSQLTEGQTPASTALTVNNYTLTATFYGAYTIISDVLDAYGLDELINESATVFGEYAGITFDYVCRNELVGNCTTQYQGGVSVITNVDNTCKLTVNGIKNAVTTLRANDVPPFPDGKYKCIMHPYTVKDITNDPDWKEVNVHNNNGRNIYGYKIGEVAGCEIYESTNSYYNDASGSTSDITGVRSTSSQVDVYSTFVFGPEAFGCLEVEGQSAYAPQLITSFAKDAGSEDALRQRNTSGFKGATDTTVFSTDRIVEIRHAVSS